MISASSYLLGQFRPVDSFVHRLDVRAKLGPIFLAMVLSLMTDAIAFYVLVEVALLLGLMFSRVGLARIGRSLMPVFILTLITAAYHLIFTGGTSEIVVEVLGWSISKVALEQAAYYSMRLLVFVSVAFLLTLTTSPSDLADAFGQLARPLERLRVPVADLTLIVYIAVRFIPILSEEFEMVKHAQMIRGVNFKGSFVNRAKKLSALLIPVFMSTLQRADELAVAIEARGYGRVARRTTYRTAAFNTVDALFIMIASLGLVIAFVTMR